MNLLSNGEVADAVVPYINQVVALLSEPACQIIKPIVIDYNLIECLPSGRVFNISKSVLNTWVKYLIRRNFGADLIWAGQK